LARRGQTSDARLGRVDIGQLTDVVTASGWHDRTVVITIRFDAADPHYDADYDRIATVTRQATRWVVPQGTIS
jgi:hypothetical protein